MKRFLKISRLLKISRELNIEAWQEILEVAKSNQLPAEFGGVEGAIKESADKVAALKSSTNSVIKSSGDLGKITAEQEQSIRQLAANKGLLNELAAAAKIANASMSKENTLQISKRAGVFGSIWSAVKGTVGAIFHYFPLIGVVWALYEAKEDFSEVQESAEAIKNNFSELGETEKLFNAEYIKELIDKHRDDPDKMLMVAKLNNLAEFYARNFYMLWVDLAWFIADLVGTIFIIGSMIVSGGFTGIAAGLIARVGSAIGLGSGITGISIGWFNTFLSNFESNRVSIVTIAEERIRSISNNSNNTQSNDPDSQLSEGSATEEYEEQT